MKNPLMHTLLLSFLSLILAACVPQNKISPTVTVNKRISPTYDGPPEIEYCLNHPRPYLNSVNIRGAATYQAREYSSSGLGAPGRPKPIRHAEIRVTNQNGEVIQCAQTTSAGTFLFALPQGDHTYTVSINARANNNKYKASILNAPEKNQLYALTTQVQPTASKDVGTLNASATDEVLGGAFNILDQILDVNNYLRQQVEACSFDNCDGFSVAPKVSIYWEKGFNPGSYYGNNGASFYVPNFNRVFILGGVSGDTDNQDTDHFDNSIIIHEYAHFLEDVLSKSDSPGGIHSGNKPIDPRLAWSEGFANFLQAAVLNDGRYIDTRGNSNGSTDYIFKIDLEAPDPICTSFPKTSGCDIPDFPGEGNYREFSITRFLWDTIDNTNDNETFEDDFSEIWASFVKSDGIKHSDHAFRAIGLFQSVQSSLDEGTDWSHLRTIHKHQGDTTVYANPLTTGRSCPLNYNIIPYGTPDDNGSFRTSHLFKNNDFYRYTHSGGDITFQLNYKTTSGDEADLDLYIYNSSARFGMADDVVGLSRGEPNGNIDTALGPNGITTNESEVVVLSNLAAGEYLINVLVYTGSPDGSIKLGGSTNYDLEINDGVDLCP